MKLRLRWLTLLALGVGTTAMASIFGSLFAGTMPTDLGVRDGRLAPCPDKPNCVSSQATDAGHVVAPLAYSGSAVAAMKALVTIVTATPGATIIVARDDYLQATFATSLMGFVDDVEFYIEPTRKVINVRSASRLGTSDLGVNRKRVEALRHALAAAGS
ncbi:MAG: DUF1499 domain-containing protein [Betaproteobacteria bacterium]